MKYVSGRVKELKVGISSYSEDKTPLSVVGNMNVVGIISATTISISTTTGTSDFANLNVSGVSTFAGAIDANGNLDVDGHTELDDVNVSGVTTFASTVNLGDNDRLNFNDTNTAIYGDAVGLNVESAGTRDIKIQSNASGGTSGDIILKSGSTEVLKVKGAGNIVGAATSNIVPFLYSNYSLFPSATTYHGAVAHAHNTGKLYYAHAGNWIELVNKETNGTVGTGTEKYDIGITSVTNLRVAGISTYDGNLDVQSSVLITGITTIGGLVDINAGAQANTLKVEDLTDNRVVIAGTGGELEDDANLTFNGTTFNVGSAITMYQATGIVSATSFFGDGSGLENTGATLSAASGSQRLVLTSLTSGTMTSAATDADLSFNATSNLLSAGKLLVSGISTFTGNVSVGSSLIITTDKKLILGPSGYQFEIYSNTGGNYLKTQSGGIHNLVDGSFTVKDKTDTTYRIEAKSNEVDLYYNGSKKFNTTGYGVTVYGTTETQKLHVTGISTFAGIVSINNNLQTTGNVTLGSDANDVVTVNSKFNSDLDPNSSNTYDLGNGTGYWKTLWVHNIYQNSAGISTFKGAIDADGGANIAGGLVADTAKISDLTNTRVVYAGASGELQDSANLTFNGTSLNGTFTGDGTALSVTIPGISTSGTSDFNNLNLSGIVTAAGAVFNTAKVSDLTDNRIVIAGVSGELEDTSKLTFDGSTLTIVGNANFTGNVSVAGTLTSEEKTNIDSIGIVTARTGVRINSGGLVISSGVATFTDAIDSNGGANISGGSGLVASTAKISDLTNTRVVFSGAAGELQDNSGFTFNGSTVAAPAFSGDGSALTGITAGGVGAIGGLTVKDEGVVVGTAGSVSTLDFKGVTITAIATPGAAGVATITSITDPDPEFSTINVTGISTFNNDVLLGDSDILGLGAAGFNGGVPDLRFYHNGNSSNIANNTGDFYISQNASNRKIYLRAPVIQIQDGNSNSIIETATSGGITVKHNNSTKLETLATGIRVTGTAQATDFNSTSDIRLKDNIQIIEDPLAKLVQIEGVSFNWKEDNRPALGVIADQVQEILPELVTDGDPKTVNYNGLIGLLIEAVKEQQVQITELKSKLDSLS